MKLPVHIKFEQEMRGKIILTVDFNYPHDLFTEGSDE